MATKSVSAPASRVYTSAPRRRQARIGAPYKVVRDPSAFIRNRRNNQRQQTLTQLDFSTTHERLSDEEIEGGADSDQEDELDEWQSERPSKRQRADRGKARATTRSQKTLTQMDAILMHIQETEQDDETMTDFGQGPNFVIHQDAWNNPFSTSDASENRCAAQASAPSAQGCSLIRTPARTRRAVVPSSQSPNEDELLDFESDDNSGREVSPSPMRRAPLQEMPASAVHHRDSSPAVPSNSNANSPTKSVPDEQETDDETDENLLPGSSEWNIKAGKLNVKANLQYEGQPESSASASARSKQRGQSFSSETADTSLSSPQPSTPFKKPPLPARLSSGASDRAQQLWTHSPSPLRESFSSRLDSQQHNSDRTPEKPYSFPSLNETADIITASQMMASSDSDEL